MVLSPTKGCWQLLLLIIEEDISKLWVQVSPGGSDPDSALNHCRQPTQVPGVSDFLS